MVDLNKNGEVADFLDTTQFFAGKSAYMCVSFGASLIKHAGMPGQGPNGTVVQAVADAMEWYGRLEGGTDAANKNGMSVPAMETMLTGMGLRWTAETIMSDNAHDIALLRLCLKEGAPLLVCGHETGMYDLALGDRVPYNWTPTGNHAIVVSGIDENGNLLVHDTANVDEQGKVRPGPRTYDSSKMQIVSVTSVQIGEAPVKIDINTPGVENYFLFGQNAWQCKQTGKVLHDAILAFYQGYGNAALCGLTFLGLPISNEVALPNGNGASKQFFERGCLVYDPEKKFDSPPGSGSVYVAHCYGGSSLGADPGLLQEIAQLKAQPPQADPHVTAVAVQAGSMLADATGHKFV